jgi:hypothetical protein
MKIMRLLLSYSMKHVLVFLLNVCEKEEYILQIEDYEDKKPLKGVN